MTHTKEKWIAHCINGPKTAIKQFTSLTLDKEAHRKATHKDWEYIYIPLDLALTSPELLEALKKVEWELLHILNAQEFTANGQESKYCQFTMNKVMEVFKESANEAIAKAEGRES